VIGILGVLDLGLNIIMHVTIFHDIIVTQVQYRTEGLLVVEEGEEL
jgi:hypothetical protein